MTKGGVLERLIAKAREDEAVLAVILFGSEARGQATSRSDVDICLVLQPQAAEQKAEKRMEYLGEFDLDVNVFQALPLPIRRRSRAQQIQVPHRKSRAYPRKSHRQQKLHHRQ